MSEARVQRRSLSAAQSGIWFAHQMDPTRQKYKIGEYVEIHGPVHTRLFDVALRQVVRDIDALRMRSVDPEGRYALIDPQAEPSLVMLDVSAESDPDEAALAWIGDEFGRPVDLEKGPLYRMALIKAADDRFILCHWYHHIVIDGHSRGLIIQRLADVYTALVEGTEYAESRLGSLPDLHAADEEYRASAAWQEDRAYWLGKLTDRPEPTRLDGRPEGGGADGATEPFLRCTSYLPQDQVDALRGAARAMRAHPTTLVMAAVAIHCGRATGQSDVLLSLPVGARTTPATKAAVGMTSNVIPLRVAVRPQDTLEETVRALGPEVRTALKHQRFRHEDLRRELGLGAGDDSILGPALNIMLFDHEQLFAGHPTTVHNLSVGPVDHLSLVIYDRGHGRGWRVDFDADPAFYSRDDLKGHQRLFLRTLVELLARPDLPVGELDLVTPEERRELLEDRRGAEGVVPEGSLAELFEAQAGR
ncbi:condensation domain-containing protein, partial [Streptomyces sp. NPDC058964]|uniref:condensation domain-containing protein n=1 Tax=Streptomyces sp. NPDC058964 TaxID=3346681 RepID=UPI0036C97F4E